MPNKVEFEGLKALTVANPWRKGMFMQLVIIGAVVGGTSVATPIIAIETSNHEISYKCSGVDENWLKDHPFVTDKLPSQIQHSKELELTVPEITGYSFVKWNISYNDKNVTLEKNDTFKFKFADTGKKYKDVVVTAEYEINTYNVTLNLKDGVISNLDSKDSFDGHTYSVSNGVATTTYTCLDEPFKFPTVNKVGYDFSNQGWLDEGRTQHYEGCDTSLLRDVNLCADWEIHPYNISYSFSGEGIQEFTDGVINNNPRSFSYEDEVILTTPFIKGYTFSGWYNALGDPVTKIDFHTVPENDNVDLEARFEPIDYNIYYSDGSNSDHTALPTSYKRCSSDVNIPAISPIGYTFKGWISSNATAFGYTDTIAHGSTGDITLTADIKLITYHATFAAEGILEQFQNSFSLKDTDIAFDIKSNDITLPLNPEVPGYDFVGYFDQQGNELVNIPQGSVGDKVITTRFTPHVYQLTLVNTAKGTKQIEYTVESSITLENPTSSGYTFEGWLDEDGHKITSIGVGDALSLRDFTLTSDWSLDTYDISYNYEGLHEGAVVSNENVSTYDYETDVTLNDLSVSGYTFKGWYDSNNNVVTTIDKHTMTGDKTFTAKFDPIKYSIKLSYRANGTGESQNQTTDYYVYTSEFTLPDLSSTTRRFVGWKEVGNQKMYYPGHKFGGGDTTNYSLQAVWSYIGEGTDENPYQIFDEEQLQQITELDKSYKLMDDIIIYSNSEHLWTPIGVNAAPFAGKLDGNNKTINMYVAANSSDNADYVNYFGIFGYLSNTAYVHDFNITGSIGASDSRLPVTCYGLVASYSSGVIQNVNIDVPVYLTSNSSNRANIGGFVGENVHGSIINCVYARKVIDVDVSNIESLYLGGIAGYGEGGEIISCSALGNLIGKAQKYCYVGGILGDRKYDNVTRISTTDVPTNDYPVGGTISATIVDGSGSTGVYGEGYTNGVLGKKVSSSEMTGISIVDLVVDDYYYITATSTDGHWIVLCWVKYLGNGQWDNANSKNQVIYAYY